MYNEYKANKEETAQFTKQRLREEQRAIEDKKEEIMRKQERSVQLLAEK